MINSVVWHTTNTSSGRFLAAMHAIKQSGGLFCVSVGRVCAAEISKDRNVRKTENE